jgi:hypothetical protein
VVKQKLLSHKLLLIVIVFVAVVLVGALQVRALNKAHSTFANYYKFRGCTQLVTKTSSYGVCKTSSGKTIKIVQYQGKWYLDGDLPTGFWGHIN